MKRLISAMMVVMFTGVSAFAAEGVTYYTDNSVSSENAAGMSTVIVAKTKTNGENLTDSDIVYIDQADSVFSATQKFLLKENPDAGAYTIAFGGGKEKVSKNFYIGLDESQGDMEMTEVGCEEVNGSYNIGYTVTVDSGEYRTVILKTQNTTLGYELPTKMTGNSGVILGIQINGVSDKSIIEGVYLSTRIIGNDMKLEEIE